MNPTLAELCRTNPKYREKWERQGQQPSKQPPRPDPPHWIKCPHRGKSIATISGRTAGVGCGTSRVDVYWCNYFEQPILKQSPPRCRQKVAEEVEGYTGRTCKECQVPSFGLPMPTGGLTQDMARGILTGANEKHWPHLGAMAISAYEQGLGFAVADHGLLPIQRAELNRIGVKWIEHSMPILKTTAHEDRFISSLQAWWKPWICEASPFDRSAWIDADAVIAGDITPLFTSDRFSVATQFRYSSRTGVYELLHHHLFPHNSIRHLPVNIAAINTGIMAFSRDDPLLLQWQKETLRLLDDPIALDKCYLRDQSGFFVMLVKRHLAGDSLPVFLPDEYNFPADGLSLSRAKNRRSISNLPQCLLEDTRSRHPGARIVHWMGSPKPTSLYASSAQAKGNHRLCGIVACVGLSDALAQTLPYNLKHFDEYIVVTTSSDTATQAVAKNAQVVISDRCYEPGDTFNKGKLLNDGLKVSTCDWILFHDADIAFPSDFRRKLHIQRLDPSKLHYAIRFDTPSLNAAWKQPESRKSLTVGPYGYFQLWNRTASSAPSKVSENWPTAATSDTHFKNHWLQQDHVKLPISVAHLQHGDWGQRWNGIGRASG